MKWKALCAAVFVVATVYPWFAVWAGGSNPFQRGLELQGLVVFSPIIGVLAVVVANLLRPPK